MRTSSQRKLSDLARPIHLEVGSNFVFLEMGEPGPSRCLEEANRKPLLRDAVAYEIHTGKAQLERAETGVGVILCERRCGAASTADSDVQRRRWNANLEDL